MLGSEQQRLIGPGTGVVVGTVSADGEPHAARAWATEVLDAELGRIRIVIEADDPAVVANLAGGAIAVTGADVRTLQTVQLKGHVDAVEPAAPADLERMRVACDEFFAAISATDGTPTALLMRMLPHQVVACEMTVSEVFDQTPGPGAGRPVDRGAA